MSELTMHETTDYGKNGVKLPEPVVKDYGSLTGITAKFAGDRFMFAGDRFMFADRENWDKIRDDQLILELKEHYESWIDIVCSEIEFHDDAWVYSKLIKGNINCLIRRWNKQAESGAEIEEIE